MDYQPSLEEHDGIIVDMYIEELLNLIYKDYYDAKHFNEYYTAIVKQYINPECPFLMASHAGKDKTNAGAVHYLSMLRLDYSVINSNGPSWPLGGFPFMPNANIAVSVHHPDGATVFDYAPGTSINQASLACIMQTARQIAIDTYNQPELALRIM